MLASSKIIGFVPTKDSANARSFYEGKLGFQFVSDDMKRGVAFEKYPFVQDKELGIWTAPNGDKVAWFKDPDGNVLSVSQHK